MRELLQRLREELSDQYTIQFKVNSSFYELNKSSKGEWSLITVFGVDLRLDTNKLKGLSKNKVIEVLKDRFKSIQVY